LVHKLDRFSHNHEESTLFKSLLRKHCVMVKSITGQGTAVRWPSGVVARPVRRRGGGLRLEKGHQVP
jgi:hypothetical protein